MRYVKANQIRSVNFSSLQTPRPSVFCIPNTQLVDDCLPGPTSISLSTTLQQYINSDSPSHGLKIHSHILKTGYQPNMNITIKLLILYLKSGYLHHARRVFEEMTHPTLSAYNYLLNAYVKHGQIKEAFKLVHHMRDSAEKPDSFTLSLILKAWTSLPGFLTCDIGRQVHAQIIKHRYEDDIILFATLIDSYVKSGKLDYARYVYEFMLVKNVICSTSLISGYMNNGLIENAKALFNEIAEKDVVVFNAMIEGYSKSVDTAKKSVELFIEMQRLNFLPNISTFASLIGACSLLTSVEISQQFHSHLIKISCFMDIKIGSALIDMYSKCGRIGDARQVFDDMPEKNIFSWTSMIDGYGKNGMSNEVIELIDRMQNEHKIKPNYVTFLCAISACAYAGLVEKGQEIFDSMKKDYSLKPKMEHYACMVNLLGRAGSVKQAWDFVMSMPEKPNSDVWAALLGSCRLHGELEMASVAAKELFKLCSDGRPGSYVAYSNAMAAAGRWDCVDEVRELMKMRGISKDIGFSWTGSHVPKWFDAGIKCE